MMFVYIMAYISIPASHIKVKDKAAQDLDYKYDSTLYKERYLSPRQHSTDLNIQGMGTLSSLSHSQAAEMDSN